MTAERIAALTAATAEAGRLGEGSCDDLAAFYNEHHGPLPYARKHHPEAASMFVQVFMAHFNERGLTLYSTDWGYRVSTNPDG